MGKVSACGAYRRWGVARFLVLSQLFLLRFLRVNWFWISRTRHNQHEACRKFLDVTVYLSKHTHEHKTEIFDASKRKFDIARSLYCSCQGRWHRAVWPPVHRHLSLWSHNLRGCEVAPWMISPPRTRLSNHIGSSKLWRLGESSDRLAPDSAAKRLWDFRWSILLTTLSTLYTSHATPDQRDNWFSVKF